MYTHPQPSERTNFGPRSHNKPPSLPSSDLGMHACIPSPSRRDSAPEVVSMRVYGSPYAFTATGEPLYIPYGSKSARVSIDAAMTAADHPAVRLGPLAESPEQFQYSPRGAFSSARGLIPQNIRNKSIRGSTFVDPINEDADVVRSAPEELDDSVHLRGGSGTPGRASLDHTRRVMLAMEQSADGNATGYDWRGYGIGAGDMPPRKIISGASSAAVRQSAPRKAGNSRGRSKTQGRGGAVTVKKGAKEIEDPAKLQPPKKVAADGMMQDKGEETEEDDVEIIRRGSRSRMTKRIRRESPSTLNGTDAGSSSNSNVVEKHSDVGGDHSGFPLVPHGSQNYAQQRKRMVWTDDLHNRFVEAVETLGIDQAVPTSIMAIMNMSILTRENVASHLQKFRTGLKKEKDDSERLVVEKVVGEQLSRRRLSINSKYSAKDKGRHEALPNDPGSLSASGNMPSPLSVQAGPSVQKGTKDSGAFLRAKERLASKLVDDAEGDREVSGSEAT